ncbi:MAG: hypothetical protein O7D86_05515 [Proteobacteria bacterium]|nr:hypothetical protein [Pseudomonadota bacterium]
MRFYARTLGVDFVVRFQGNSKVTERAGETRSANDWAGKNGRARRLRNVAVTAKGVEVPVVVGTKTRKMKQAWCIVATNPALSAGVLSRWQARRWGREPQCRDTKDSHFGTGLSETAIGSVERRDRLLLIGALSVIILTLARGGRRNIRGGQVHESEYSDIPNSFIIPTRLLLLPQHAHDENRRSKTITRCFFNVVD